MSIFPPTITKWRSSLRYRAEETSHMLSFHLIVMKVSFVVLSVAPLVHSFAFSVIPSSLSHWCQESRLHGQQSQLTDWVVENLEGGDLGNVTSSSSSKAGESDTLPSNGLCIADFRILPASMSFEVTSADDAYTPIRLFVGRNGWGTGVHPTTRLCLEWLSNNVQNGDIVLDYGCGSGILSIAALHSGAARVVGVDVEAEALVSSARNIELNGFDDRFEGFHTREILPFGLCRPAGVDVCIANILVGQLVRSSMISALVTNTRPGGLFCLSGIRPEEVCSLKKAYDPHIEWIDDQYSELSAKETEGSIESYGFDVGTWSRLVGRVKDNGGIDAETMSELAVS